MTESMVNCKRIITRCELKIDDINIKQEKKFKYNEKIWHWDPDTQWTSERIIPKTI